MGSLNLFNAREDESSSLVQRCDKRMAENTINVCLCVLKAKKKNMHNSYCIRKVPVSDSVVRLKAHLLERCTVELLPATYCNFSFGYISEGNKKFFINTEVQLAEALSLVKKG